jgi:hypothetical protein
MVVVMNSDGSKGVAARVQLAVSSPVLLVLAGELLAAGVFIALPAALLIVVPAPPCLTEGPQPGRRYAVTVSSVVSPRDR